MVLPRWRTMVGNSKLPKIAAVVVVAFILQIVLVLADNHETPGKVAVDFSKAKSVSDPVFQVYKEQFSYDETDLNARVESRDESSEYCIREKITFDAAYGDERIIAHLFLPKNATPPYQTVIYFPGEAVKYQQSSESIESSISTRSKR